MLVVHNRTGRAVYALVLALCLGFGALAHAAEPVVITYSAWGAPGGPRSELVEQFNRENPHIRVEMDFMGVSTTEYIDRIVARYAAGVAPDVMDVDGRHFSMVMDAGMLMPLTRYAERDREHMEGYIPQTIFIDEHSVRNGVLYGIPLAGESPRALFFNEDLFQAAGLESPIDLAARGEWTWERYLDTARLLTMSRGEENVQWGTLHQFGSGGENLLPWARMNGTNLIDSGVVTSVSL